MIRGQKRNFIGNMISEGVLNLSPLLWILWLTREKGVEVAGAFIFLGSVFSFGKAFIEFGMNNEAVAQFNTRPMNVAKGVIVARAILMTTFFVGFFVYLSLVGFDAVIVLAIIPLLVAPFCVDWIFKAVQQGGINALAASASLAVSFLPLMMMQVSIESMLIVKAVWYCSYAGMLFIILKRRGQSEYKLKLNQWGKKEVVAGLVRIKESWAYAVSSIIVVGSQNLPIILVTAWMAPFSSGVLALLLKMYSVFLVMKYVVMITFLPSISKISVEACYKIKRYTFLITLKILVLALSFVIALNLFAGSLMTVIGLERKEVEVIVSALPWLSSAMLISLSYVLLPAILIVRLKKLAFLACVSMHLITSTLMLVLFKYNGTLSVVNGVKAIACAEVAVLVALIYSIKSCSGEQRPLRYDAERSD